MYIFRSNNLETLSTVLAKQDFLLKNPLERSWIVSQNQGMSVWLSQSLAKQFGIFSAQYYLVKPVIIEILEKLYGEQVKKNNFSRNEITLALFAIFSKLLRSNVASMQVVKEYIQEERTSLKLMQLAQKMAALFDKYLIYRPQELLSWQNESDSQRQSKAPLWQVKLWQELVKTMGKQHFAYYIDLFCKETKPDLFAELNLPKQIYFFAITSLPPLFCDFIKQLDNYTNVSLFLLSPSKEYWADIRSKKEQIRSLKRTRGNISSLEDMENTLHYDEGNTLLANNGKLGRDFQALLESKFDYQEGEQDLYKSPSEELPLGFLKNSLLYLKNKALGEKETFPIAKNNLLIYSCHNRIREVETVQDILLQEVFENGVQPHEIAVMMPNIETYADLIPIVFTNDKEEKHYLPYRVSDRSAIFDEPIIRLFLKLLTSLSSRASFDDIFELISNVVIQQAFKWQEEEVEILKNYLKEASLAWGLDGKQREQQGFPFEEANSWSYVVSRLLLGWATTQEIIWQDRLAMPLTDGASFDSVRKLILFLQEWEELFQFASKSHSGKEWCERLGKVIDTFFSENQETQNSLRELRLSVDECSKLMKQIDFESLLDLDCILSLFESIWQSQINATAFLRGGITFCSMLPMRSIPFRIIVLMGMDEGEFPRMEKQIEFDFLYKQRELGDRVKLDEDRYLFLETLLSARDKLVITYQGQDARKNVTKMPSLLVTELVEALSQGYALPEGYANFTDLLINKEQAFPFDSFYFSEPRAKSYSVLYAKAAQSLYTYRKAQNPRDSQVNFFVLYKGENKQEKQEVDYKNFMYFWRFPIRYFLQDILNVKRKKEAHHEAVLSFQNSADLVVLNREPLRISSRDKKTIILRILSFFQKNETNLEKIYLYEKTKNELPWGQLGRYSFQEIAKEATLFWDNIKDIAQKQDIIIPKIVLQNITLQSIPLTLYENERIGYTVFKMNGSFILKEWLQHLLYTVAVQPVVTKIVGYVKKGNKEMISVSEFKELTQEKAKELLNIYADFFIEGQTKPLCFEAKTAWSYVEALRMGRTAEQASKQAEDTWQRQLSYAYDLRSYTHIDKLAFSEIQESDEYTNLQTYVEQLILPIDEHYREIN